MIIKHSIITYLINSNYNHDIISKNSNIKLSQNPKIAKNPQSLKSELPKYLSVFDTTLK